MMKKSNTLTTILLALTVVGLASGSALADWDPEDAHKMHFPQLPNIGGPSVYFSEPSVVADDWQCSDSGDVLDVHFWIASPWYDQWDLTNVYVGIHENDSSGPFNKPGPRLWNRDFSSSATTVRDYSGITQVNIVNIPDPFIQQRGQTYWLALMVFGYGPDGPLQLEWQTSQNHFGAGAVGGFLGDNPGWQPLGAAAPVDMSFVITPEPVTLAVLALGSLLTFGRARKLRRRF